MYKYCIIPLFSVMAYSNGEVASRNTTNAKPIASINQSIITQLDIRIPSSGGRP